MRLAPRPDAASDTGATDASLPHASSDAAMPDATATESACADGQNNDGDTLTDCADPDCNWHPCRAPAGPRDAVEHCTGGKCPPDGFQYGTVCRAKSGDCDVEERCPGTSAACPPDQMAPSTTVCRPEAGSCDVEERCDGVSSTCPADVVLVAGVECRASVGGCDVAETCYGTSGTCNHLPAFTDPVKPNCGRYTCDGQGGQYTSCGADIFNCSAHCRADYWCWAGNCEPGLKTGQACLGNCQCESDLCLFWSCM